MNFKLIVILLILSCNSSYAQVAEFKISSKVTAEIDKKLFGQFMEKPSWGGEIGGDVAVKKNGRLIPQVQQHLKEMHIPIIRYAGGTDVDYYPWYYLINNVPGHHQSRPAYRNYCGDGKVTSDNRLGLDRFLTICEDINSEPLLVVNIGDAFFKKITIDEAAKNAAGMVAYCNAKNNKQLPKGMMDWTAVRKANGRTKPYHVKYFEVGNEPWAFFSRLPKNYDRDSMVTHYLNCLEKIVNAMLEVDNTIQIITDGEIGKVIEKLKSRMGSKINYVAFHAYRPWFINEVKKNAENFPVKQMSEIDIWNAWVCTPEIDSISGLSRFSSDSYQRICNSGYPLACTEWNWNGGWRKNLQNEAVLNSRFAKGIGAAGFIHALMRDATKIKIGNQSMLVGNSWDIAAIHVDTTKNEVRFLPTGKVAGFYSKYHGNHLLELESKNLSFFNQPFKMNGIKPASKVAFIDAIASCGKSRLFLHAINRNYNDDMEIEIDISDFDVKPSFVHHYYTTTNVKTDELGFFKDEKKVFKDSIVKVVLPKHSISIIEFEKVK